jgi:hypothetical protein
MKTLLIWITRRFGLIAFLLLWAVGVNQAQTITIQPKSQTVNAGEFVSFYIAAEGSTNLSYPVTEEGK